MKGHPKGLISAALSNMGERFGYYIMNAVLTLFLCSKFGLSDETIGIKLTVNDVGSSVWNNALEGNTAQMWVAAWQSTADPDMYQVYHSSNAHGKGTNSNHYQVDDPDLDALIIDGRTSADTEYRKSVYKQAMEIIMDWGVELPVYQRKDCTVASTIRVDCDTLPKDMTPYWGWKAEIETLAVK